ncbi:MAG: DUF6494 family protein [Halofilum sp. (in: g-proteobacteria)]|nr:DUF6494 family protein [Halofilum sp. (in: g-proteobacteria)]
MDEEQFNKQMRAFLKKVGITSQRELEKAVYERLGDGRLQGNEALAASVVLRVPELDLELTIDDEIRLE